MKDNLFIRLVRIFTVPVSYPWRPYHGGLRNCAFAEDAPESAGPGGSGGPATGTTRRVFLRLGTAIFSAFVAIVLTIPIIGTLIGPSFRIKKPHWSEVGDIESLFAEQPTSLDFPYKTQDAFLRQTVTHRVWVIRHSSSEVTVFSPICPHLGCYYDWHPERKEFICPCHGSIYSITGKVLGGPAPRPLDTLPWKLENGDLYVEWERFEVGIPKKIRI
jgi:menaquinol-cytochrome c reductase iron-sulfur subunit